MLLTGVLFAFLCFCAVASGALRWATALPLVILAAVLIALSEAKERA